MADKVLSMIGMARRAGEAQTGAFLTERSICEGTCELIILATDTAQNNAKKFPKECALCAEITRQRMVFCVL